MRVAAALLRGFNDFRFTRSHLCVGFLFFAGLHATLCHKEYPFPFSSHLLFSLSLDPSSDQADCRARLKLIDPSYQHSLAMACAI